MSQHGLGGSAAIVCAGTSALFSVFQCLSPVQAHLTPVQKLANKSQPDAARQKEGLLSTNVRNGRTPEMHILWQAICYNSPLAPFEQDFELVLFRNVRPPCSPAARVSNNV